jgi:hypothetical protein
MLVGCLAAALVACGGSETETQPVDNTGGGGAGGEGGGVNTDDLTAEEYYKEVVHPELVASCGICHAADTDCTPQFMAETAGPSYSKLKETTGLVTHPDNSNLIIHGAHTGPALTVTQEEFVTEWLSREHPAPPEGPSVHEALDEFGACMLFDEFMSSELYKLPYQQTDAGPCGSCHRTGEAGTWLGYNEMETFAKNTQLPWIKRLVRPVYDGAGNFVDLEPSNRFVDKVENSNACGSVHPAALVSTENKEAIKNYVNLTKARWESGNCE